MTTKNIVAFIPARSGSKGLKRKNLRMLNGVSLIGRAVLAAKSISAISYVVVTTDCQEIANEARNYGAYIPFIRAPKLSGDFATTEATLLDALQRFEKINNFTTDLCVYFSPSEGFLNPACVERGINLLSQDQKIDSYFSCHSTQKNYWTLEGQSGKRIYEWMSIYESRQTRKSIYREDTGRGMVSQARIWHNGRRIGDNVVFEIDNDVRANLDIHTELDLKIADLVINELGDHSYNPR